MWWREVVGVRSIELGYTANVNDLVLEETVMMVRAGMMVRAL
jgi:hypothetical protein